jgi:hypothetical protein
MFDYLLLCMEELRSYHINPKQVLTAATIVLSLTNQARAKLLILLVLLHAESISIEDPL